VSCWDGHLPIERHKSDAGALERTAPSEQEAQNQTAAQPKRVIVSTPGSSKSGVEDEILVVVSKVRKYIQDKSGMNTSAGVYEALTEKIKNICDQGIEVARGQGRKTVMDRDIP